MANPRKRVRLHISPLTPSTAPHILPQSSLPTVSYHNIQTFPERSYAFADVDTTDAARVKSKYNGTIFRGVKMSVEEARTSKLDERIKKDRRSGRKERDSQKKSKSKSKKDGKGVKVEQGVTKGVELPKGRRIQRGWQGGDKNDAASSGSKCLFRTKVAEEGSIAGNSTTTSKEENSSSSKRDKKKNKNKKGEQAVLKEFTKNTHFPSFLKDYGIGDVKQRDLATEFVEGKGWVNGGGKVIEEVKVRPRREETSVAKETKGGSAKTTKVVPKVVQKQDTTTDDSSSESEEDSNSDSEDSSNTKSESSTDSDSEESSDSDSDSESSSDAESVTAKGKQVTSTALKPTAKPSQSSSESESESSSSSSDDSDSDNEAPVTKPSIPKNTVSSPSAASSTSDSSSEEDSSEDSSEENSSSEDSSSDEESEEEQADKMDVEKVESKKEKAEIKKKDAKTDEVKATASKAPKPKALKLSTERISQANRLTSLFAPKAAGNQDASPFKFFGGDADEGEEEQDDGDVAMQGNLGAANPITPIEPRYRSGAPTPDTAHPSRMNSWLPSSPTVTRSGASWQTEVHIRKDADFGVGISDAQQKLLFPHKNSSFLNGLSIWSSLPLPKILTTGEVPDWRGAGKGGNGGDNNGDNKEEDVDMQDATYNYKVEPVKQQQRQYPVPQKSNEEDTWTSTKAKTGAGSGVVGWAGKKMKFDDDEELPPSKPTMEIEVNTTHATALSPTRDTVSSTTTLSGTTERPKAEVWKEVFYKKRGEWNREWKRRRKDALKTKRKRDNAKRSGGGATI